MEFTDPRLGVSRGDKMMWQDKLDKVLDMKVIGGIVSLLGSPVLFIIAFIRDTPFIKGELDFPIPKDFPLQSFHFRDNPHIETIGLDRLCYDYSPEEVLNFLKKKGVIE